jgi:DNA repair photolyase
MKSEDIATARLVMATAPTAHATHANRKVVPRRAGQPTPYLFPIVPSHRDQDSQAARESSGTLESPAPTAGIARLAASSPLGAAKRGTEYFLLPVKSILNRCESERVPFGWTVNPYRGCEFGCLYCYARYTHEYMNLDGGDFERKIYVKQHAGWLAGRDLAETDVAGEHIAIGTATDPYQPAEGEFRNTRAILERMAQREGLSVSITTKSDRVVNDIDILREIHARSTLFVNLSVTTVRPRLARILEPRAPRPDLRLAAVRKLSDAGLSTGVLAMPVLPGITDSESDLDALARAAAEAGAQWFATSAVFLMPSAQKEFFPFLDKRWPKLARRYREWYAKNAYAPEEYRQKLSARAAALRKKYGLGSRPDRAWVNSSERQLPLELLKA